MFKNLSLREVLAYGIIGLFVGSMLLGIASSDVSDATSIFTGIAGAVILVVSSFMVSIAIIGYGVSFGLRHHSQFEYDLQRKAISRKV